MADNKASQQSPMANQPQTKRSPLLGVSTDEHDISTGHGGSKFDASIMENNLAQNSRMIQDQSILDHGSQDFLGGSNQQSGYVAFNPKSSRRGDDLNAKSLDQYDSHMNSIHDVQELRPAKSVLHKGGGKKGKKQNKVPLQMAKHTIDRIIYPVQTKRGLKYPKQRQSQEVSHIPQELVNGSQNLPRKSGKLLDGFLILYSCRVKLPHEAIKSKLDSQNIMEVIEEDLCYFQNLSSIDLSDNHVRLEQLRNLKSLTDINLQYNYIRIIPSLGPDDFERLETINLSYNSITPASIRSLYSLKKLKSLDLQANNLVTLPEDIKKFENLEDLNLSSNQFSSNSSLVNPALLFKAIGQISKLKRLNFSRNKFTAFHAEMLTKDADFVQLQELDFAYNQVSEQEALWFVPQMKHINMVIITGNPLALQGQEAYAQLEQNLQNAASAVIINDDSVGERSYLRKVPQKKSLASFPYPNPIKLLSRERQKEIKGEYLNAELMHQGVALPISDIRPDGNIESEIFPPELTREAQNKDVFTPPNHQQMRFMSQEQQEQLRNQGRQYQPQTDEDDQGFFITEDIRADAIKEENESENQNQEPFDNNHEQEQQPTGDEDDDEFDFGRAKMDFFKKRAREILMNEQEMEYEGAPMPLGGAYKNLKHAIKNPAVVYTKMENKPHYMKMTFSQGRQAPAGAKFLELSKANNNISKSVANLSGGLTEGQLNPLLLSLKNKGGPGGEQKGTDNKFLEAVFGNSQTRTKKEIERDRKVEALLEAYKKQDEDIMRKEQERELTKKINQKALLDKFGFTDEEEDRQLAQAMNN